MNFNQVLQYNFPTVIRFGAGAITELAGHLKEQNLASPLVVTDPVVAQLDFFKKIIADLEKAGLKPEVFSNIYSR